MNDNELDSQFQKAVALATQMTQASLPQDVQLRLYACYKHATAGALEPRQSSTYHLRDAFKTNAWMQISHLSIDDAKKQYIEIINSIVKKEANS
jgi:acyl-CoA-binding protein